MTAETTYCFPRERFGKAAKAAFDCGNCVIKCIFKSFSILESGKFTPTWCTHSFTLYFQQQGLFAATLLIKQKRGGQMMHYCSIMFVHVAFSPTELDHICSDVGFNERQ